MDLPFTYRVALIDDHKIFREGFETLLGRFPGIVITGSYAGPQEMFDNIERNIPEVIFMDMHMPDIDGIVATKRLIAFYPEIKIIALTQNSDGQSATLMFNAGASGYMTKSQAFSDIKDVFISLAKGEKYVTPSMALEFTKFAIHPKTQNEEETTLEKLKYTARELSIMAYLSNGKTDKEIGAALDISPKTVDKDKRNIMKIMGVNKVTQIVAIAIRKGLIE